MIKGDTIHLDREGTVASGSMAAATEAERPRFPEAQEAENKGN